MPLLRFTVLTLVLILAISATDAAQAMYDPGTGRFLQRDPGRVATPGRALIPRPGDGYQDGMNLTAAHFVQRGGFDPYGLEVIFLVDPSRAEDQLRDADDKPIGAIKDILPGFCRDVNRQIDGIIEMFQKLDEDATVVFNGEEMSPAEAIAEAEKRRTRVEFLPSGREDAFEAINNEIENAGEDDQVSIETHTLRGDQFGEAEIRVGDELTDITTVIANLEGCEGTLVFGSCHWDQETLQRIADGIGSRTAGNPGTRHPFFFISPDGREVKGPADLAEHQASPNEDD